MPVGSLLRNRSGSATFLAYHSVAEEGPTYLTVTPDLFERQLALLKRRGLRTGGLAELDAVASGETAEPTVFLTFDDGFRDNHEVVLPLLREHGFRAFVYVLPDLLDDGGPLAWPEVAEDCARYPRTMRSVDWRLLEEMAEGGFEVGSHTLGHPHLTRLSPEELRQNLSDSRARIRDRLGACDTIAYPFGDWSQAVADAADDCGYRYGFTLPTATGQSRAGPLSIPRINVDYRDSERRFGSKLGRAGKALFLSPAAAGARRSTRRLRGAS